MLLNMLSRAVNANPVANIDFIFTNDKSRLLFFSFSSSRSIFFLCCLSSESPSVSFLFSTEQKENWNELTVWYLVIDFIILIFNCNIQSDLITSEYTNWAYIFCFVFQFQSSVFGICQFDKPKATSILENYECFYWTFQLPNLWPHFFHLFEILIYLRPKTPCIKIWKLLTRCQTT